VFTRNLLLFLCALVAPLAAAEDPRPIEWEDLTVKLSPSDNPFNGLSPEQLKWLADVSAVRTRKGLGVKPLPADAATELEALSKLAKAGIDADALMAKRDEFNSRQQALANAVNPKLNGALIRMPGYLLPLEFSGKKVSEFLLVPWAGACIHTPPPPPNQIVHVKADQPFEIGKPFEPVWVTGRIAANATRKSVFITDGSSEVDIGYAIRATRVERY